MNPDEEALFARVLEAPGDDAPRAVLADYWLERGNPRGEILARQLRGEDASDLIAKHEESFLGALAAATSKRQYARGFVVQMRLEPQSHEVFEAAMRTHDFALVENITRGYTSAKDFAMFVHAAPSLRKLTISDKLAIPSLLERRAPWPVTELEITQVLRGDDAKRLMDAQVFPRVKRVRLIASGRQRLAEAVAVFAAHGIREISTYANRGWHGAAELVDFIAETAPDQVRMIEDDYTAERVTARRAGSGLDLEIASSWFLYAFEILRLLKKRQVPIVSVKVHVPEGKVIDSIWVGHARDALSGLDVALDPAWSAALTISPEPVAK